MLIYSRKPFTELSDTPHAVFRFATAPKRAINQTPHRYNGFLIKEGPVQPLPLTPSETCGENQ